MGERLKGDERRRVIIDAALALFARKGFRGTTTKEIAEAAGCSEATIFKYFTSKDELYSAILEVKSAIEETLAKATEAAAKGDDAGVFRAVGLEALTRTEQDPSLMRLLLYSALEGHELSHFFFESKVRHLHEFLSNYIEQRVTDGVFRPVNPLLAARGFVGMVVHYLLIHEIFGVKRPVGILPEEVVETFVTLFVTGIRC
ncbi:MAG TPA: TetR/AcrR family transcriptional regulator [Candidatus Tectomicrobia bacterium]|jgi:AcrR family transcriptional regulator|nr:TetR/AcrR family transcriptional regulator [Candidatus Tectomicrobia bacterium]